MITFRLFATLLALLCFPAVSAAGSYPIVDTGQQRCYSDSRAIQCPVPFRAFSGQDAQYAGHQPRYRNNGDGTISDLVTGLMWVRARGEKMSWSDAVAGSKNCRVGGYSDWRAPSIKELYSLMDFRGASGGTSAKTPYLDARYFEFKFGDTSRGERDIDCQDWSATRYVSTTMGGQPTAFGVNFADGRIKGYGTRARSGRDKRYIRYVRGNSSYGHNQFQTASDGTVLDQATGLTWQRADSGKGLNWQQALAYCNYLQLAGRSDWRLPNAKELQSIVDYTRSPATTNSAAIDPLFSVTETESYFWSSTTHNDGRTFGANGIYVAFGRAMGFFSGPGSAGRKSFMDVHGAGAQRSDPKSGNPSRYSGGFGPQGDDRRIYNYARCVRGGVADPGPVADMSVRAPWEGVVKAPAGTLSRQMGTNAHRQGMGQHMRQGQGMGQEMGSGMRPGHGPPVEAQNVCSNKSDGDSCSFSGPHGTISGTCRTVGSGTLACVPQHAPGGPGGPGGMGRMQ